MAEISTRYLRDVLPRNRMLPAGIRPAAIEQSRDAKPVTDLPEPSRDKAGISPSRSASVTPRTASTRPRRCREGACRSLNASSDGVMFAWGVENIADPVAEQVEARTVSIAPAWKGDHHHCRWK